MLNYINNISFLKLNVTNAVTEVASNIITTSTSSANNQTTTDTFNDFVATVELYIEELPEEMGRLVSDQNTSLISILSLIITPIITLLVMYITLRFDKRKHKIAVEKQEEMDRISIMPYFVVSKIYTEISRNKNSFTLKFTNYGNGTATELQSDKIKSERFNASDMGVNIKYYFGQPFYSTRNIASYKDECELIITQSTEPVFNENYADEFSFEILFKDMAERQYKQTVYVQYTLNDKIEVGNVSISKPTLLDKPYEVEDIKIIF